jgi:branched-chain amino acid transport system permease protein
MDIQLFFQLLINGLLIGGIYVLVASGLTLILGVTRILNVAHGVFYMLGAYFFVVLNAFLQLHWVVALIGSTLIGATIGLVSYLVIFRHTRYDFFATLAVSVGLLLILNRSVVIIFGERDLFITPIFRGMLNISGVLLPYDKIAVLGLSLLVMLGLYYFLNTEIGKAAEAISLDSEAAALQGIDAGAIFAITMVLGCALAGIAGAIVAPIFGANLHLSEILIMVLLVVWLGGFGSMKGAVLMSLIIGLVGSFGYQFFGAQYLIGLFAIIGIIIYFKPGGLFGEPIE